MRKRAWLWIGFAGVFLTAQPAFPSSAARRAASTHNVPGRTGAEDGNDGLAALQRGDFDESIRLFTRALEPGRLSNDDAEFAYFNRAKAFAAKGDFDRASDDLQAALKLLPSDTDAQAALKAIPGLKAQAAFDAAMAPLPAGVDPWGLYGALAGHCYWYQRSGHDPHEAFIRYVWLNPSRTLGFQLRTKSQQIGVGEYTRNPNTGNIIFSGLLGDQEVYSTLTVGSKMVIESGFYRDQPSRELMIRTDTAKFLIIGQIYSDHAWKDGAQATLVETSTEELVSAGMIKQKRTCP